MTLTRLACVRPSLSLSLSVQAVLDTAGLVTDATTSSVFKRGVMPDLEIFQDVDFAASRAAFVRKFPSLLDAAVVDGAEAAGAESTEE